MSYDKAMIKFNPFDAETLGEFCRIVRERADISQRELAERNGIAFTTVGRTETGRIERPYEVLRAILGYLSQKEKDYMFDLLRAIDIEHLSAPASENAQASKESSAPSDSGQTRLPAGAQSRPHARTLVRKQTKR